VFILIRKLTIVAAALLVLVGAFLLKERRPASSSPGADVLSDSVPAAAEASSPEASQEKPLPRLVDLGAGRCIPCKKMAPILDELASEYRDGLIVEVIDVWKNPEAGKPYGIRMIPTQIFFDASGAERFRHEGFMAKEAILAKWKELGVELSPKAAETGL
jgi:thioredoxin 1